MMDIEDPSRDMAGAGELEQDWRPIGHTSNQLVLYHPASHALRVRIQPPSSPRSTFPSNIVRANDALKRRSPDLATRPLCLLCRQPVSRNGLGEVAAISGMDSYFQTLEHVHSESESFSEGMGIDNLLNAPQMDTSNEENSSATGYYVRFFKEVRKLGMGAEGSVYLAVHHIEGDTLGTYAVKKIAVGESKEYLHKILHEVKLLEVLRHTNIIPYYHAWIDTTRFSDLAPPVLALHVLMMYASGGNLDSLLLSRSHSTGFATGLSADDIADAESIDKLPKEERIKAFKRRRQSAKTEWANNRRSFSGGMGASRAENRGVLLLSFEEIVQLFGDIIEGLSFLHSNSILHLDLKCSNVLLHWEEGKLVPKAMLSDFGTSEEMLRGQRERTGHTGTMEYMAPETLVQDSEGRFRPSDSHADMWSLGMILYKMMFLKLPYEECDNYDVLRAQIISYKGFLPDGSLLQNLQRRHIPQRFVFLLKKLLDIHPEKRPSAEKTRSVLADIKHHSNQNEDYSSAIVGQTLASLENLSYPSRGICRRNSVVVNDGHLNADATASNNVLLPFFPSPKKKLLPSFIDGHERAMTCLAGPAVRLALLFGKLVSIQPSISGVRLPPAVAVILILLALTDLAHQGSLLWSLTCLIAHCAAVLNFSSHEV
ncbi:other/IKS protein kinase [Cryptococcus neoformans c8]|nr:other/IKS protein kinase [Cryptococcus neoformans var. grubii AD1-83a]OXG61616.1 other/IKS protein kinase [Cryptococcus neoformans var. grubii MW-RSA1955]OXG65188.1 other/IKS protein kinase [Cryptococcus neoformans var. grubii c8]OXG66746.1 other/IKS protein kinase [Cryptococcus neoformans var. grubii CHC193]OXH12920.1 other/IKS protein kinase [Cryptococcus neoformans var. grubii A5-35-17]OXH13846.1 other/IKS protein kinase [Cryptococcus neoformans var. grubii A1-35-8]